MERLIRRATPADARDLTQIAHASKRYWGYSEELIAIWRDDLTLTERDVADDFVVCIEHGGRIAGFYSVSGEGRSREIEHMWVLPGLIGTGLGRVLFEHMRETLRALRVERLVIASDPNAAGFYERMGASRVGDAPATPAGRTLPLLELRICAESE